MNEKKLEYLSIDKLIPHEKNPRKELGDLTELAESIKVISHYLSRDVCVTYVKAKSENVSSGFSIKRIYHLTVVFCA